MGELRDRVEIAHGRAAAHGDRAAGPGLFGDGARGGGGQPHALDRDVVGVGVPLPFPGHGPHADALLQVAIAALDDAFFERDRILCRDLGEDLRMVDAAFERRVEPRGEPAVVETEAFAEEPQRVGSGREVAHAGSFFSQPWSSPGRSARVARPVASIAESPAARAPSTSRARSSPT